jgi:hypothetical protein
MTAGGLIIEYKNILKKLKLITTGYNFNKNDELLKKLSINKIIILMPATLIKGMFVLGLL